MATSSEIFKTLVSNRKAFHEYRILETLEAGIVLRGTEVKSIRLGKANIADAWVLITDSEEAFLQQISISPYSHGNIHNHPEQSPRKLLLKRKQILDLQKKTNRKGLTIIPLSLYLKKGLVKVSIAVVEGKKDYDKRQDDRAKEARREMERAFKRKRE